MFVGYIILVTSSAHHFVNAVNSFVISVLVLFGGDVNVTGQLYVDFFLAVERIDNFQEVCGECQDNAGVTIQRSVAFG